MQNAVGGCPLSLEPEEPQGTVSSAEAQLSTLFGSYKAEWLSEQLFDLFTEPGYWPELTTDRPCVLVGGRGTGKTTVLKLLSYEGQFARQGHPKDPLDALPFIGLYARVDTNQVRTFVGPEVDETTWSRIFGHYLNLTMALQALTFAKWYEEQSQNALLSQAGCADISLALNLAPCEDTDTLKTTVRRALIQLQAHVNNIGEAAPTGLSMQKVPIDLLVDHLSSALGGRKFFYIFDEYENFEEYQQKIVNTMVKHAGNGYSFKIGVREMGIRTRATLNEDEQLISPADYVRIRIGDRLVGEQFKSFAASVCNSRLAKLTGDGSTKLSVSEMLPKLSEDDEARLLGAEAIVDRALKSRAARALSREEVDRFRECRLKEQLTLIRWTDHHHEPLAPAVRELIGGSAKWKERTNNYGYALLFTIRRGRGQRGHQKYYAGWDVAVAMSAGNIRYVLELVEQTLLLHIRNGGALSAPVKPGTQTDAAQAVGRKNLTELEGISVHGAQLTRLVLGLGRVFELFATAPLGHSPEVNEFDISEVAKESDEADDHGEADELLRSAVMHLALLRYPGSKLSQSSSDTRDFDYRLHPIFSAAFQFSHRRKRKMQLSESEVLGLVRTPRETISSVVRRHRAAAEIDFEAPLPDQLALFESYFRG